MSLSSIIPSLFPFLPSSTFCLSVCSPAVIPPCSPPSVWIVCLLLLLTTIAIQTSALPHSFPSALETLILRLPAPLLTYPLLHSTHHLCNFTITFPLLTILNPLFFKMTLTTIALSLSIAPSWILNPKLIPACPYSLILTSLHHLTQTPCPMAAAPTRKIPPLTATCSAHPGQSQTTHTSIPGIFPQSIPNPVLTLTLCPAACQMFVPTPTKTSSPGQILILKPCCCPVYTLAAKLIPVPHYNLNLTLGASSRLCSHVGGPRWFLMPPSLHTQLSQSPLPIHRLTTTHPVAWQVSL